MVARSLGLPQGLSLPDRRDPVHDRTEVGVVREARAGLIRRQGQHRALVRIDEPRVGEVEGNETVAPGDAATRRNRRRHELREPEPRHRITQPIPVFAPQRRAGHDEGRLLHERERHGSQPALPVVVVEGDAGEGVPRIGLDNREAQRHAASHLRALGHSRVAIVALPVRTGWQRGWVRADDEITIAVTSARVAGAHDVYPDAPVFAAAGSFIDEGLAAGREIFADPIERPTAVIAQSDLLAAGVIRAAEEAGLRVPEDVSVTGFDGIVVDGLAPYELTTLVQPATDKGRAAGQAVAAMLEGRDAASVSFTCVFRPGNTTAPPAQER